MRSWTPQKQPPARTARSSVMCDLHLVQVASVALGLHIVSMNEPQRGRIDAIAQSAAVRRAVRKHVAEVAVGMCRAHFHAAFDVVWALVHVYWIDRPGEARPAGSGVVLVDRCEQRLA